MKHIVDAIINLDRRWIFLLMTLAILIPIVMEVQFTEFPTKITNDAFDAIDGLDQDNARVLFTFDFDPGSAPELQPMARALTWHAAKKGAKLYFVNLWPFGAQYVDDVEDLVLKKEFGDKYVYGQNYVILGYRQGGEGLIRLISTNLAEGYPTDKAGKSLSDMPVTSEISNIQDIDLIVSISAGSPGTKEWVQYASVPYDIPVVGGCTGVQAPILYPYYEFQMKGMLAAIKGAAEYEARLEQEYPDEYGRLKTGEKDENGRYPKNPEFFNGHLRMGPQLFAHLLILALIVLGNIILFLQRRMKEAR